MWSDMVPGVNTRQQTAGFSWRSPPTPPLSRGPSTPISHGQLLKHLQQGFGYPLWKGTVVLILHLHELGGREGRDIDSDSVGVGRVGCWRRKQRVTLGERERERERGRQWEASRDHRLLKKQIRASLAFTHICILPINYRSATSNHMS